MEQHFLTTIYDSPKVTTTKTVGTAQAVSYNTSPTPANNGDSVGTSWRSVLIGGMGFGGAAHDFTSSCNTSTECVKTPFTNLGYSSYFALDVTEQDTPKLMWEYGSQLLGYSTVGPAIIRIKAATDTGATVARNGRWFAVLASGPTGPVEQATLQMKALSDQPLRLFVLDLKTGTLLRTFSNENISNLVSGVPHTYSAAMPSNAFAGSLSNATIDADRWDLTRSGSYSDDAIYIGYTRKDTTSSDVAHGLNKFSKGGILRVLTGDNLDPTNWTVSKVIDDIGPVTSTVTKLQDKPNNSLWLYFGTGRYFYKSGATVDEDFGSATNQYQQLALYGVKDPCYVGNDLSNTACSTTVAANTLTNQTTFSSSASIANGWYINLAKETTTFKAQRVVTDPVATSTGILFFTAFKPTVEVCGSGGETSLWAVNYSTAGPPSSNLKGQALLQLSTGAFQQVNLSTAFTQSGGRETVTFKGVPPKSPPAITANTDHFPSKRVLHIMEK